MLKWLIYILNKSYNFIELKMDKRRALKKKRWGTVKGRIINYTLFLIQSYLIAFYVLYVYNVYYSNYMSLEVIDGKVELYKSICKSAHEIYHIIDNYDDYLYRIYWNDDFSDLEPYSFSFLRQSFYIWRRYMAFRLRNDFKKNLMRYITIRRIIIISIKGFFKIDLDELVFRIEIYIIQEFWPKFKASVVGTAEVIWWIIWLILKKKLRILRWVKYISERAHALLLLPVYLAITALLYIVHTVVFKYILIIAMCILIIYIIWRYKR